jgi:Uncharacterized protein conserved in bacteria
VTSNAKIDRLGEELRQGRITAEVLTDLEDFRSSFGDAYAQVCQRLASLNYVVTGRPSKSTGAIVDKLRRQSSRLSQMQDIAGCRVVVEDTFFQRRALLAIDTYLDSPQIFDRRKSPSHGYRAVHFVATFSGKRVEVQLRTRLQHVWSELSERLSDVVDPALKYGTGDPQALEFLNITSGAIREIEEAEERREQLMRHLAQAGLDLRSKKKIKKDIRGTDRVFFSGRERLMGFLQNVKEEIDYREGAT